MEIDFKRLKIKEIKEDINLFMFNSRFFTFNDMKNFNKLMEELTNVKISINY